MNCKHDMSFKCRRHSVSDHSQLCSTEQQSVWWSNVRQKQEASSLDIHWLTTKTDDGYVTSITDQYYLTLCCQGSWSTQSNIVFTMLQVLLNYSDWCPCTPGTVHLITLHKWCTLTFISTPVLRRFYLRLEIAYNLLEDLIDQSAAGSNLIY